MIHQFKLQNLDETLTSSLGLPTTQLGNVWAISDEGLTEVFDQALNPYQAAEPPAPLATSPMISEEFRTAVVPVRGTISPFSMWGDRTNPFELAKTCDRLAASPDIDRVIFSISSPGGHVVGVPEAVDACERLGKVKKTISYTSTLQASAAQWFASSCSENYASPSSLVGSIGVFVAIYDFSAYLAKAGVKLHLFRDGEFKALGLPGKELTEAEQKHIDAGVQKISKLFKGYTRAHHPGIKDDAMQGHTMTGEEGVAAKLIDATCGSLAELIGRLN